MTASTDQERAEFLEQVGHLIMDGTIETRSTKRAGISFACGNLHAAFMVWRAARRATAVPVPQGWIDPNDKAQKQYLPHIGERVLFKHDGCVYLGKHTGGSFKAEYPLGKTFGTWDCKWMYPSVLDAAAPQPPANET